jgi:hypothetical protein
MYNQDFFDAYHQYLREPAVRAAHDRVIALWHTLGWYERVLDLGCGQSMEFLTFCGCLGNGYRGVDLHCRDYKWTINGDYRALDLPAILQGWQPTSFVSLFSTEVTAPFQENYAFYEKLFTQFPSLQGALVSGCYHPGVTTPTVTVPPHNIVSHQTLEPITAYHSLLFSEWRLTMPVTSTLFGTEVEIWKFLERRPS